MSFWGRDRIIELADGPGRGDERSFALWRDVTQADEIQSDVQRRGKGGDCDGGWACLVENEHGIRINPWCFDAPRRLAISGAVHTGGGGATVTLFVVATTLSGTAMSSTKPANDLLNPRTTTYEFMGPPGAFLITVGVPIVTYLLYFGCSESAGACPPSYVLSPSLLAARVQESVTNKLWWANLWDTDAALIYLAWYAFCVVAWAILPGDWIEGATMRNGQKKKYKINGIRHRLYRMKVSLTRRSVSYSVFNLAPRSGYHHRLHPSLWSTVVHISL